MPLKGEDYRQWESKHPERYHKNRHFRPSQAGRFVGVDGEGWGKTYALLADSEGNRIENVAGLTTAECLEFLCGLRERCGNAVFVGFALNYDINHWIEGINNRALVRLHQEGQVRWEDWWLQWAPGRWFQVKHLPTGRSARVWDTFPFFQSSFLKACAEWGVEVPSEVKLGKEARHAFGPSDLPSITDYNRIELCCLVELVRKLKEGLYSAGIPINQWYGAGAVATRLFASHGTRGVLSDVPAPLRAAAMGAMFGGRIETGKTGRIAGPIWNYDLRSAYADALGRLPILKGGEWVPRMSPRLSWDGPREIGLYHVEWECPRGWPYYPFPWRDERGAIYCPPQGRGWYWDPEIRAAMLTEGVSLKFLEGWEFVPKTEGAAFPWAQELFDHRRRVGSRTGEGRALKLGLAALYGKLAQRDGVMARVPTYRQYEYAGYVTSFVRARLWLKALGKFDRVVSFATDGIFATEELGEPGLIPSDHGDELGDWEVTRYKAMDSVMPGVYRLLKADGSWDLYGRGYGKHGIPWDDVIDGWTSDLNRLTVTVQHFHTLGECIHRTKQGYWIDRERWRSWTNQSKQIRLRNPSLKRIGEWPYDPQFGEVCDSPPYEPRSHRSEDGPLIAELPAAA